MDLPTLRGLFTLVLMIAFVAIVIWAWSSKRREDFAEAARLPLDDEKPSAGGERTGKPRNGAGERES
jgi:cytochrome c oxidase cbb3-type subunit 4